MTWNPFSKKTDRDPAQTPADPSTQELGKGRPTPRRRVAEQQRLRPLVPKDRKASVKAARQRIREREDAEYQAMKTGDTAHMPRGEQIPWRVYIRNYVDARFNLGEFFIPAALVILVGSMAVTVAYPQLRLPMMLAMYAYLIAVIVDVYIMWRGLRRKLVAKFGEDAVKRGSRSGTYAWSRAIQVRRWRLPKPQYNKRGHWPK